MRPHTTLRLSAERMEAFVLQCGNSLRAFEPSGDHEQLLYEFLQELYDMVAKKYELVQGTYTLKFTAFQAMAFIQLFKVVNINHCPYSRVVVGEAMAMIDKESKSPKKKYRNYANRS